MVRIRIELKIKNYNGIRIEIRIRIKIKLNIENWIGNWIESRIKILIRIGILNGIELKVTAGYEYYPTAGDLV